MTKESHNENGMTLTNGDFTYDAPGQLTEFRHSDGVVENYAYDAVGNMLKRRRTAKRPTTPTTQETSS